MRSRLMRASRRCKPTSTLGCTTTTTSARTSATATRAAVRGTPWRASSASYPQDKEVKKTANRRGGSAGWRGTTLYVEPAGSNLPELLGGCMCGAIRYVLKEAPEVVYYCHCNDCKRSTGSAFHVGLVMRTDRVEIVDDILKEYMKLSDSGNHMTRLFCSKCGSPLFTKDSAVPGKIPVIKAEGLDQPEKIQMASAERVQVKGLGA